MKLFVIMNHKLQVLVYSLKMINMNLQPMLQ